MRTGHFSLPPSCVPFLSPISLTVLCISLLLTDIALLSALFSLRIVVLEAGSTKEWRIKPLTLSHPPILSFLPSFPPALNTPLTSPPSSPIFLTSLPSLHFHFVICHW